MSALQTFSPLSLSQLTRDLWGQYDGSIIAQLAALADDPCYMMKFYKAPSDEQELMAGNGYAAYGMEITPGSIIFGFYLPTFGPAFAPFNVQITDVSLNHKWFDAPTAALFLSNIKVTYQANLPVQLGSFPNLLCAPYPVVGSGLFMVEIQETSGNPQRIELVFGVLEVCG
jgi:hypothetical protein